MRTETARQPGPHGRRKDSCAFLFASVALAVASVVVAGALAQWHEPERARVPMAPDRHPDPIAADRTRIPTATRPSSPPWSETRERLVLPEPFDGIAWNPDRPLEVAVRMPIERGVSVGALAEIEVPRAALDAFMGVGVGWNASATIDLDLDVPGQWRLSAGAGARSLPVEGADVRGFETGDAEGVVWLRIGTTF